MDAILSIFTGNGFLIGLGGILAMIAAAFFKGRSAGKQAERDRARAKEVDAYEQHLKEISGAHDARNRVDPDRVPDHDKYRRD